MSKKAPVKDETQLVAVIHDLDRQIVAHEKMRRQIPLEVLQPQLTEALTRVRESLARNSIPPAAGAPILEEFKVGQVVGVTMSPEQRARVLAPYRDPQTGEEGRLLITETGEFVTAKLSELSLPGSSPAASTSTPPVPGRLTGDLTRPEVVPTPSSGFRAGDRVETPFGPGTILQEQPGAPGFYIVTGPAGGPYSVKASEMKQKL
jgi:hypothetical protein